MHNLEELRKNIRIYASSPPNLKIMPIAIRLCHESEDKYFRSILTCEDYTFNLRVELNEDKGILKYRLYYYDAWRLVKSHSEEIIEYLVKENFKKENDICNVGIEDNELFVEIKHRFDIFPVDYHQLRVFEKICLERIKGDIEYIETNYCDDEV